MAKHNNPSIIQDVQRILNPKAFQGVTSQVGDILVPVINIEPYANIVARGVASDSTSQTILTTPADIDFYLQSVTLSVSKSALATSVVSFVSIFMDSNPSSVIILEIRTETLTANEGLLASIIFPKPIKLQRGTSIVVSNATAVASIDSACTITGYTRDTVSSF